MNYCTDLSGSFDISSFSKSEPKTFASREIKSHIEFTHPLVFVFLDILYKKRSSGIATLPAFINQESAFEFIFSINNGEVDDIHEALTNKPALPCFT